MEDDREEAKASGVGVTEPDWEKAKKSGVGWLFLLIFLFFVGYGYYDKYAKGDAMEWVVIIVLIFVGILVYGYRNAAPSKPGEVRPLTMAQQKARLDAQIVCPHCQTRGRVTTCDVKLKKGVSGGKAVGALMTGGLSLLAVGLSRKEDATKAECSNCGSIWHF